MSLHINSKRKMRIHGGPNNLAHFCTPYNFIKYGPIFKLFSLSESGEHL